jgi:hypothetical protein
MLLEDRHENNQVWYSVELNPWAGDRVVRHIWPCDRIHERGLTMSEQISCTLAENAIDYLILAGEQAREGSARMVKHGLATLWDGLELLLKARLEAEDWKLLFQKPANADSAKFTSGDFFSVGFDVLIERLNSNCGITLTTSQAVVLDRLRKLRNKVRHFTISTDRPTAIPLIVAAYSFALEFIGSELEEHLDEDLGPQVESLRASLAEFSEFVAHRQSLIQPTIDATRGAVFLGCPTCFQEALYNDGEGDTAICLFCGRRANGEQIAAEISDQHSSWMSPKDRDCSEPDVEMCPECSSNACLAVGRLLDKDVAYVCLCCGESGDYSHCVECDCLYSGETVADRCDGCYGDLMDRND